MDILRMVLYVNTQIMVYTTALQLKITPSIMKKMLVDVIPSEYQWWVITIVKPLHKKGHPQPNLYSTDYKIFDTMADCVADLDSIER